MTCRECADFLSEYLDDQLPAEVRATFERHLTACHNCQVYLEQLRQTIVAGKNAFEDEQTREIPEEVIRAILAARRPPS